MTSKHDRTKQIVGIGSVVVDSQMLLNRFPQEDQKEVATAMRQQTGGPVPTALAMLRRLGHQCHQIGPWGCDANGAFIEADLRAAGITWSSACAHRDCQTGVAHVWTAVGCGSRTIVAQPARWQHLQLTDNDLSRLRQCDALHLDGNGEDLAIEAAEMVAHRGGMVLVDAGAPKAATQSLMSLASVFSFPERFIEQFFGHTDPDRAANSILNKGAQLAVCTRGKSGALVYDGSRRIPVEAFPVDTIDSTGAGDVFCGALLGALLEGQHYVDAASWAAAAAALKCTQAGNRDALPDRAAIDRLVQQKNPQRS